MRRKSTAEEEKTKSVELSGTVALRSPAIMSSKMTTLPSGRRRPRRLRSRRSAGKKVSSLSTAPPTSAPGRRVAWTQGTQRSATARSAHRATRRTRRSDGLVMKPSPPRTSRRTPLGFFIVSLPSFPGKAVARVCFLSGK
ncbi:hypothetical protein C4D60_Mb01t15650 [Musa balbisiana]|uniref:Uncharacterized protein n=1 Tax=Musa balbisiana TaxID=52838 RepID=A0A4S8JNU9_MUSBA|nr:hypothetical protein C4D60_Mb01t15650 [Musa balbisiana]